MKLYETGEKCLKRGLMNATLTMHFRAIKWTMRGPELMKGLGEKTKAYKFLAGKA
jgi:hypothetical protein